MTDENTITAAILGELVPELEYAAPVLLERFERGEPLVQPTSQTDLGFEGGAVDPILLELFKALVPYVKTALGWGVLNILQAWHVSKREARHQAELQQAVEKIADLLARHDGVPVSTNEVLESFAAASSRVSITDDPRAR